MAEPTLIAAKTRVRADLLGAEPLHVQGRIDGTVDLAGRLVVEKGGIIVGEIRAEEVVIAGIVAGNVTALHRIELKASARVVGDLVAPSVLVEAGARFRGDLATAASVHDIPALDVDDDGDARPRRAKKRLVLRTKRLVRERSEPL